jgi:cation transport regulator ChaC
VTAPHWIFGYGSLVWRPELELVERRTARLDGWARRFWQGSTDHRGVPGAPGRVVTLVEAPGSRCWGVAYRVGTADRAAILERLDRREQGGYERRTVTLWLEAHAPRQRVAAAEPALLYLATPANPSYLGPAPLEAIAAQVVAASGPSGRNADYVLRLAAELRALGVDESDDEHVFALERLVLAAGKPALRALIP